MGFKYTHRVYNDVHDTTATEQQVLAKQARIYESQPHVSKQDNSMLEQKKSHEKSLRSEDRPKEAPEGSS